MAAADGIDLTSWCQSERVPQMSVFTPEHKPLDQLFSAGSTYRIPSYQRPYSWESLGKSDRDSQVNQMWNDLWVFFSENQDNSTEYFLGSMVIIADPKKSRTFEVIDGQQRLTTLILLLAAMRCLLIEQKSDAAAETQDFYNRAIQTLDRFLFNEEGIGLVKKLKLKVERRIGTDYNRVLEDAIHCRNCAELDRLPAKVRSIADRYFRNRDYLSTELRRELLNPESGRMESDGLEKFNLFFQFLEQRVAIVQIVTTEFSTAWRIFEILNNRGLPLSNLDLLRNLVLEELDAAGKQDGDELWDRLERTYDLPEDFTSRWAETKVVQSLRGSAFNELQSLYRETYKPEPARALSKIEVFVEDLERNLRWYNRWINFNHSDQVTDLPTQHALAFIKLLGNERYSANLILALFRCCNYDGSQNKAVYSFLATYRTYGLHVYLRERYSAASVYRAIRALNEGQVEKARELFILTEQQRKDLAEAIKGHHDNEAAKRLLAAYVWHQEEQSDDVATQRLDVHRATLEHIIPQDPALGSNWLVDFDKPFRDEYTHRLGNMTLLTQSKNSANRNFDFAKKRLIYEKSLLKITLDIAAQSKLTAEFFRRRHQQITTDLIQLFC